MSEAMSIGIISAISAIVGAVIGALFTLISAKKSFQYGQLDKSARIAEFLSFWITGADPNKPEDKRKLIQFSYEMSLYLPKEIYEELALRLTNNEKAKDVKDIIIMIRKLYKGERDKLKAEQIIHW